MFLKDDLLFDKAAVEALIECEVIYVLVQVVCAFEEGGSACARAPLCCLLRSRLQVKPTQPVPYGRGVSGANWWPGGRSHTETIKDITGEVPLYRNIIQFWRVPVFLIANGNRIYSMIVPSGKNFNTVFWGFRFGPESHPRIL